MFLALGGCWDLDLATLQNGRAHRGLEDEAPATPGANAVQPTNVAARASHLDDELAIGIIWHNAVGACKD